MTPWQLAGASEHSQQRALFAWMNCAAEYGFGPANHADTYNAKTRNDVVEAFRVASLIYGGGQEVARPRPELRFAFAIHNQGHGDAIRGNRARAEGVKAGAPDLMLPVPRAMLRGETGGTVRLAAGFPIYAGLFIEMKKPAMRPKREGMGGVKTVQLDYHKFLTEQGYCVRVCYNWEEARNEIMDYLK